LLAPPILINLFRFERVARKRRGYRPSHDRVRQRFFRPLLALENLERRELLSASAWIIDDGDPGYVESVATAPIVVDDGDFGYTNSGGNVELVVDNSSANYSESPAEEWHQSVLGGQIDGQSRYSWESSASATFQFSGLTNGKNDMFVTTPGHPNSTVASYTVTSGLSSWTFSHNQRNATSGWLKLGEVTVSGNAMTVTVSQGDNSGVLRADAVRVVGKDGWAASGLGGNAGDSQYSTGTQSWASYSFAGLTPGTHELLINTPGHSNSTNSAKYTVSSGGTEIGTFYANQRNATNGWLALGKVNVTGTTAEVKLSQNGSGVLRADGVQLRGVDGWSDSSLVGVNGDSRYSAGNTAWARYDFTALDSGDYEIFVNTPGHANSTGAAAYTVTSGGTILQSASLSQTTSTGGWKSLGIVAINSGDLQVEVAQAGSGMLRADAVKVERDPGGDLQLINSDGTAVAAEHEDTPGVTIRVNDDDDDGDGIIDMSAGIVHGGDDDLLELRVKPAVVAGSYTLVYTGVQLHLSRDRTQPIPSGYHFADAMVERTVYIEGTAPFTGAKVKLIWSDADRTKIVDTVTVNVIELEAALTYVEYGGTDNFVVWRDTKQDGDFFGYQFSHWRDDNGDGHPDNAYPVAYKRGAAAQVDVEMLTSLPNGTSAKIRALGPDGIDITSSDAEAVAANGRIYVENIPATKPFKDEVDYYESFNLRWEISVDSGVSWIAVGQSRNQLYVTYDQPLTGAAGGNLWHTLVHIGSKAAEGVGGDDESSKLAVIDKIWAEFADRDVRRVTDDARFVYYENFDTFDPAATCESGREMLNTPATDHGTVSGACGAFVDLFILAIRAQGIELGSEYDVRPAAGSMASHMFFGAWNFSDVPDGPTEFDYKNVFGPEGPIKVGAYNWVDEPKPQVVEAGGAAISAQGSSHAPSIFETHQYVAIKSASGQYLAFYDPSYGSNPQNAGGRFVPTDGSADAFLQHLHTNVIAGYAKFDAAAKTIYIRKTDPTGLHLLRGEEFANE
jgi:hypothetical protein